MHWAVPAQSHGMKNSPATFQHLINRPLPDVEGCEAYINDIIIYSYTWEKHLVIIRLFFLRLGHARLTVHFAKIKFGCATVKSLRHIVGQGKVKAGDDKISAIAQFPHPCHKSKKQVMRFLGMPSYYQKFCPNRNFPTLRNRWLIYLVKMWSFCRVPSVTWR